ncbi:NAD-dependent deacetylase [Sphaerotilus hippei]|uniref:NAD-dependent protein deacylase n=1 Tax=Sphaerotilus hippei TaxID=744406 RepID=A0A318H335_9BURK|nr:NAD-dependent deacylase [Sphaerotilus hippei]PXW92803.1 NAD-dependent deacetylase [Sphaerotilus hippei]
MTCTPAAGLPEEWLRVADWLHKARHVVVVTGAGISAESGMPTFRDAQTGLWQRFRAEELATPGAFRRDPALVWGWYEWRRMRALQCEPNAGHLALAELARRVPQLTLVTQNVDDLHERAGSPDVIHLHGSLHAHRCLACARPHAMPPGVPSEPEGGRLLDPPRCAHCGGRIRPGVVWFGESLPEQAWAQAEEAVKEADLMLVIGTSGLVHPAASLPEKAVRRGCPVVVVNPAESELDGVAEVVLRGAAGVVLPVLGALESGIGTSP